MYKSEYENVETEQLQFRLDDEYKKLCKKCKEIVSKIVEIEFELESRCNH